MPSLSTEPNKYHGSGLDHFDAVATVKGAVDGDTIEISPAIEGAEDLRLIGVDTPETKNPDCGKQPYSDQAGASEQDDEASAQVQRGWITVMDVC